MVKKGPKVKILGILIKNLDFWAFLPFLTLKIKIFKIGKKTFLLMSQGPLIPKIMFPSQKL